MLTLIISGEFLFFSLYFLWFSKDSLTILHCFYNQGKESESDSVMSDSLPPHGLYSAWNSPGQNTGVGKSFTSPEDLSKPGFEPRSPALQGDSLPAEPQGSLSILEWVVYAFSSGSSRPRNRTRVSCIGRRILDQLSYQGSPCVAKWTPNPLDHQGSPTVLYT